MTGYRIFWAVVLGVITILAADFIGSILKARPGYKRTIERFGGEA